MSKKHVYANETDWFVAESLSHARDLCEDYYSCPGCTEEDNECMTDYVMLEVCGDDESLTLSDDSGTRETKTCKEWADSFPAGMLASTEW